MKNITSNTILRLAIIIGLIWAVYSTIVTLQCFSEGSVGLLCSQPLLALGLAPLIPIVIILAPIARGILDSSLQSSIPEWTGLFLLTWMTAAVGTYIVIFLVKKITMKD